MVAAAEQVGGHIGAIDALTAGITESGLRVLGNTDGQQGAAPVQGMGSDHDSLGIFQQRPSWGTVQQRLDPAISTSLFMSRLTADPGCQSKQPWCAIQDVQASAYDGQPRAANHDSTAYGGNYEPNMAQAAAIVTAVEHDASKLICGALSGGLPANAAPGTHGLPASYVVPTSANPAEDKVVAYALAQLDKPYVFGAAGPAFVRLLRFDDGRVGAGRGVPAALHRQPGQRRHCNHRRSDGPR